MVGLNGQSNLGRKTGGGTYKTRGMKWIITVRGGRVHESHHRSHFSIVATLVPPVYQTATKNNPFTDEASKFADASSESKPEGKRVLALSAVRHQKNSPLIRAQEKTRSDVKGQVNPSQASGDRWHSPGVGASGDWSHA